MRAAHGDVRARGELAARDSSLITVAAPITAGNTDQLEAQSAGPSRTGRKLTNCSRPSCTSGSAPDGPGAMSAAKVAKRVFRDQSESH